MGDDAEVTLLETYAIVGFDGTAVNGLQVHPDGEHIVYSMGNKVVIQNWKTKKMNILEGHSNLIVSVSISPRAGTFIGSGQVNHIGFNAATILWNTKNKKKLATHDLHKVRVECITFTSDERYMISVGGRDDGTIVIFDTKTLSAVTTAAATKQTSGDAYVIASFNNRLNSFITAGDGNLRVWNMNMTTKVLDAWDVAVGKLKRCYKSLTISQDDAYAYAGTTTGDLVKFNLGYPSDPNAPLPDLKPGLMGCLAKCGQWKKGKAIPESVCFTQGINCLLLLQDGCLIVGTGGGIVELVQPVFFDAKIEKEKLLRPNFPSFKTLKKTKLRSGITSMKILEAHNLNPNTREILLGTESCEIYSVSLNSFEPTLVVTCHKCTINAVAFPRGMSEVFATGGNGDVRVWSLSTCQELLRIMVPNFICTGVLFTQDGKSIITSWNDGCIRGFTPLTGRLIYCITDAHNKGVSAIDITSDGYTLISGGCEGQVRIWSMRYTKKELVKVLKEHKSPVSAIQVSPDNTEACSAATDGSCIMWDLKNLCRRQVLYANTLFTCVAYEPKGCQVLTGGSDRRVTYWEAATGNMAREVEACRSGAVNGIDINNDGHLFVTVGTDQFVKLWLYQEGIFTHLGKGHAAPVTSCKFSPDSRYAVSTCAAGTIIIWKIPAQYLNRKTIEKPIVVVEDSKSTKEADLKIKLSSASGSKPPSRASSKTSLKKEEKINAIDTNRSSVHCECVCSAAAGEKKEKNSIGGHNTPIKYVCVPEGRYNLMQSKADAGSRGSKTSIKSRPK